MTRIGILRLNDKPQFRDKIACVVAASMGIEAFFFRPQDIDFDKRMIRGMHFLDDRWHNGLCEFPDVVYNHLPLTDEQKNIFLRLADEIPFTTHRIGNKNVVLKKLAADGKFKQYLIPMHRIRAGKDLVALLERYGKIIFKPANGKRGQRIYTIEQVGPDQYTFDHLLRSDTCSTGQLIDRIEEEIQRNPMIVQPFIASETIHGHSYCMRIHVAKGANGTWKLVKFFPFVSNNKQESVSHLSHGALSTTRMDATRQTPLLLVNVQKEKVLQVSGEATRLLAITVKIKNQSADSIEIAPKLGEYETDGRIVTIADQFNALSGTYQSGEERIGIVFIPTTESKIRPGRLHVFYETASGDKQLRIALNERAD
ncbi:YheC/YheD family protein [Exiguobacterium oxidotolerans]|uniref:YheC/YheD family protein n=1 Tax=Exiguobacterium oxidotolerans TaxID=223958 RepID=UPI000494D16F|nr:YheC/YheD family protein [Exiguobacterium oxidotolerans]